MTSAFRQERRRLLAKQRVEFDYGMLLLFVAEAQMPDERREALTLVIGSFARLQQEVEDGVGIRFVRDFFGWSSEKKRAVFGGPNTDSDNGESSDTAETDLDKDESNKKEKKKRTSGRRSADEYTAADVVKVPHEGLQPKDPCPDELCDGKVYPLPEPAKLVRVTGVAPLDATRYDLQRLRCNLCGTVYTADAPEGCCEHKYDETVPALIGTLRYGYGLPHYRIEKLCDNLGVPFPSSTQWDVVNKAAEALLPVFDHLVIEAAQRSLLTIDDTAMKVIEINAELAVAYGVVEAKVEAGELPKSALKKQRTGVHTTGMVAQGDDQDIVLFLTGEKHAGENFLEVLTRRAAELAPPIRMADALCHNFIGDADTHDGKCLVHMRRQFIKVAGSFPDEVELVLDEIGLVYKHDDEAKKAGMGPDERLAYHQEHSGPVMERLEQWLRAQIDGRLVEPNSGLGDALAYLEDHWHELTLFLRVPGAPLDSNVVERSLKLAIRHRKNSLFYRSRRGAEVGDCFMSLIHTAERHAVNAFEYLVAIIRNKSPAAKAPDEWMPWNYAATMARLPAV